VTALDELARALREEGGLLADVVRDAPEDAALPAGPRDAEVGLVLEAIREGWLLHAGEARVLDVADDPDLALLAGDRLYALGLERLAALGDLAAVAELADLISLCARSHAEQRPEVADTAWTEGVRAVHREPGAPGASAGAARAYSSGR
jgi:hypothetical protein